LGVKKLNYVESAQEVELSLDVGDQKIKASFDNDGNVNSLSTGEGPYQNRFGNLDVYNNSKMGAIFRRMCEVVNDYVADQEHLERMPLG